MAYEDYLRALPTPESGGDPTARNPLLRRTGPLPDHAGDAGGPEAAGLTRYVYPEGQTRAAAELTRQNDVLLRSRLQRDRRMQAVLRARLWRPGRATYAHGASRDAARSGPSDLLWRGTRQGEHLQTSSIGRTEFACALGTGRSLDSGRLWDSTCRRADETGRRQARLSGSASGR
jgi:hypothetical protein